MKDKDRDRYSCSWPFERRMEKRRARDSGPTLGGTSTFREFSKRRNEPVTSLRQKQFAMGPIVAHFRLCNLLGQISVFEQIQYYSPVDRKLAGVAAFRQRALGRARRCGNERVPFFSP
jgi:hypothetical protein